jgi:acetyltransferase-like isoleucine patch superfamily enzyme
MINLLRQVKATLRQRSNKRATSACGEGTQLVGTVDRRATDATIAVGADCLIQGQLVAERDESCLIIGNRVLVGGGTVLDCALSIKIDDDVLISYACVIADSDNHSLYPELRRNDLRTWMDGRKHDWSTSAMRPIHICSGAWIGAHSIILKGVTIGAGAVVGMGSVVTRDVPPRTVVAGNPARVIKTIDALPLELASGAATASNHLAKESQ